MFVPAIVILAGSLLLPAQSGAQSLEQVDGFHGYEWGTLRSEISELETGSQLPSGEIGIPGRAYAADVTMLGHSGFAVFVFDEEAGGLIQGMYSFDLEIRNCESTWEEFERALEEAFPRLEAQSVKPSPNEIEQGAYDSLCEYFVFNSESENWVTRFDNILTGNVELAMMMNARRLEPSMSIAYLSERAQDLREEREEQDRTRLGPVSPR